MTNKEKTKVIKEFVKYARDNIAEATKYYVSESPNQKKLLDIVLKETSVFIKDIAKKFIKEEL